MQPPSTSPGNWQEQEPRRFGESLLWELQRHYFRERGIEAWRRGEVPHYITSNPIVASSYAHIILACWNDYQRATKSLGPAHEPFYVIELGAGSGRFAFHLLQQLLDLCSPVQDMPASLRYVLTDNSASILSFWRQHPRFEPFFANGMLDLAHFDLEYSDTLHLQISGERISAGSLHHPVVVIANYVFDSVPQDLYYIGQGDCSECLVSLSVNGDSHTLPVASMLSEVQLKYSYQPLTTSPYHEPILNDLLADYRQSLAHTHLLFPAAGLRCLQRLHTWSSSGLLVISADKGASSLEDLHDQIFPALIHHGSFSLLVNYHAFRAFCDRIGGISLFPTHHTHITVGCFLLLPTPEHYRATQQAYHQQIRAWGPDDYFTISTHARRWIGEMTVEEILAYTRLARYDSHLFAHYLPRLQLLLPCTNQQERQEILETIKLVWRGYFHLGEAHDLPSQLREVLYQLGRQDFLEE